MKQLHLIAALAAAMALAAPRSASAAEHVVSQKGKSFSAGQISIKAGDKIAFRNDDPFVHNVFSLTDGMNFDLGTYPQGQAKSQLFAKPGKFEIECAIHPEMKLIVTVGP